MICTIVLATSACRRAETSDRTTPATPIGAAPPTAVFLIVVDTLRPDRLSCYGYAKHDTPNIDRLAERGVRFTEAQSTASWTTPSMGAILTSLYPTQLRLVESPGVSWERYAWRQKRTQRSHVLPSNTRNIAEMLSDAGYYNAGFVNQPALNFASCYRKGFADWYSPVGPGEIAKYDPSAAITRQEWASTKYADQSDWGLVGAFDEWLGGHGDKEKLFAWVHLLTPHRPYEPAAKYAPPMPEGESKRPPASDRYDGEIRAVDDMIGKLTDSIERHVGLNRSLIVFTSDHGEAFGEHGMTEHGHSLHREVIHVPLIIVAPNLPAGQTVVVPMSTIDLLPTIMELTNSTEYLPANISGISLTPIARGRHRSVLYSEGMLYGSTERSLIRNTYKLMYDQQGDVCALFDTSNDPGELVDIAGEQTEIASAMCAEIQEIHTALRRDALHRRSSPKADQNSSKQAEEQRRALEALRALGYVDE